MASARKTLPRKSGQIGDRWRALVVSGLLLSFGAIALVVGARSLAPAESPPLSAAAEKEIRTGKLIVSPPNGNECQQKQFDNVTGQFKDLGSVPCDALASTPGSVAGPGGGPGGTSVGGSARLEAVRNAFQRK